VSASNVAIVGTDKEIVRAVRTPAGAIVVDEVKAPPPAPRRANSGYVPGQTYPASDGAQYRCAPDGSLRRIKDKTRKKNRRAAGGKL
jgi:hypothetical protein